MFDTLFAVGVAMIVQSISIFCSMNQINIHEISQGSAEKLKGCGGQKYYIFVANLFKYLCTKNYLNRPIFGQFIARITTVPFLA